MAKENGKRPKLPNGASRAQTQEYLYRLFKQGRPPAMALEMLKSAGVADEAMRASAARSGNSIGSQTAIRLDRLMNRWTDGAGRLDED